MSCCDHLSLLVISVLALVVTIGALLLALWRSRLGRTITSILLPLTLRIVGILSWASLRGTIALLLWWVALLTRVLLLRRVSLLLGRTLLVCFLLLAVLGVTLLWRSVGRHWPLPHDVVSLVDLTHHAHGVLLSLIMLSTTTRRHAILLGGRLLVHHWALIWLHVHVWPWPIVAHGLALGHVHLALSWHALGRGDGVIVTTHGAVAAGGHIHCATRHVGGLVGARAGTLHGHVIRTRHLSIHLVRHVWGWGATADHPLRGHVVTVRRLRRGSALGHSTRAHGHVLSGRSRKEGLHVLIGVCYRGQIHQISVQHLLIM